MAEGDRLATYFYFIRRWISDIGQAHGLITLTEIREMEFALTWDDHPKWKEYKKKYKTVLIDSNKAVSLSL